MRRPGTTRRGGTQGLALFFAGFVATTAHAQADEPGWQWLRSKNRHVTKGNERMAAGDAKGAIEHYGAAARELPAEGGVHLNRGLALLATGDLAGAREALRLALEPPASPAVRADAHYDLGIGFYREADTLAGEERHEEAQKLFREAIDAFRQGLRLRPGDRDAAWNLELAARRLQEQREKQEQKEQEQEQKQDQKQEENQQENQEEGANQQQDPSKQNEQSGGEKEEKKEQGGGDEKKEPKAEDAAPKPNAPQDGVEETREGEPALPSDVTHALDALQDSEQNLERLKAQLRARREQRRPEKDW